MPLRYAYVGPEAIRLREQGGPGGAPIRSVDDLRGWVEAHGGARCEGATFVVMTDGVLRLAPRRSEHVACAEGQPVLSAGEMGFRLTRRGVEVVEVTNQSTGYCPEPSSFEAVARALASAGLAVPEGFTHAFVFRRCPSCELLNLVKDDDYTCAACSSALPRARNLGPPAQLPSLTKPGPR